MSISRRKFLLRTSYAGAGLAMAGTMRPMAAWASAEPQLAPYLTGLRMAASPTTAYRAYRSKTVASPEVTTWIQIDLNKSVAIEAIQLFPAADQMYPGRDQWYGGQSFPLRFRIEASEDPSFSTRLPIVDFTQSDFPDPQDNITQFAGHGVSARYVRLTATRLRSIKVVPPSPGLGEPLGGEPKDGPDYTMALSKVTVLSGGSDAAVGCKVSADEKYGDKDLLVQLTRPPRQDGESIHWDNIHAVTDPSTWKPPQFKAQAPKTGVTLNGGLFQTAMQNNIE